MISQNDRTKDNDDVGLLFHSIIRYAEENEERLDCSITSVGYGNLLGLAERAATEIATQHVDEGDDWDGAVWLELLEGIGEGSLAEALYTAALFSEEVDVPAIVSKWLSTLA